MKRNLEPIILDDLSNKIVLLTGPRQTGKTSLSKQLYPDFDYFSYDLADDRIALKDKSWDRQKSLLIFDELHKMKHWKRWLKGIYDTEKIPPRILVTGSARLDIHKKVGDSLAGRYFQHRLHPLDIKEVVDQLHEDPNAVFEKLWTCSGFPEPFLKGSETYYKRWRKTHLDIILREDLLDFYLIRDLRGIETLTMLLKTRVGSTVSYASLARDLQKDINTVKRWLLLLENLYVIYRVTPYSKRVTRSLLKEPKFYFYDHALVGSDEEPGPRLENIVANALLKALQYQEDTEGKTTHLHFLRTKDGQEIDFLLCIDNHVTHIIEVKQSDDQPSKHFSHFESGFPKAKKIQLVKTLRREKTYPNGIEIRNLIQWLAELTL